jgi:hypothetical protein
MNGQNRCIAVYWAAVSAALVLAGSFAAPRAEATEFTQPPKCDATESGTRITFAVSAPTDVAVAILDARGKVVRHLAAGVLGKNAPEPLKKDSLEQSLLWDGKDDAGKPAVGGPFRVRVGLGLTPTFDKVIGSDPGALGSVRALAVGPKGELFVFHVVGGLHPDDGTVLVSVFDREGKYLRVILPYPANLPEEKLKGLRRMEIGKGVKVPFIYQGETRSIVPGAGDLPRQRPVVTRDGRLAFVGIQEWVGDALRYANAGLTQVTVIHTDGSPPPEGVLKTTLAEMSRSGASLALSPDEKFLYASGMRIKGYPDKPTHVVYKFGWDDKSPAVLAGMENEAGSDEKHLNDPRGIAVDGAGNVYVADKGNSRVAVFKPDGAFLGSLAVESPEQVEVHPRTRVLYVVGGALINQLKKFNSWKDASPVAEATLPHFKHENYTAVMALDATAEPPVLWVGSPQGYYAKFGLLRIEDKGEAFGEQVDVGKLAGPAPVDAVMDISLDRQREWLYAGTTSRGPRALYDGRAGKRLTVELPRWDGSGNVATIGRDGNLYLYHNYPSASVSRYDLEMKPLPFAESASIDNLGSPRVRGRGLIADRQGNLYVLWQKPKDKQTKGDAEDANALALYDKDGRLIKDKLIDSDVRSINSVRVDPGGNIYLAVGVRSAGKQVPETFAGMDLGKRWKYGMNSNNLDWYTLMYGSIVKFGPEGGEIRSGIGGTPVSYGYDNKTEIKGAKWLYFGASNVPSWRTKGTPDVCLCESPRFDVDDYGRSFFPDVCRFRIGVIDSAGNEICFFGSYGNQDSAGPDSAIRVPEIAVCWPHAVAAGDEAVYIGDRLNRRVVRVKLGYAAEATCEVSR